MTVGKSWAYKTEFGGEKINAWEVSQERALYGGKPLGRKYWSNHQTGLRKPVIHKELGGTTFFAYASGEGGGGGPGESLSHKLLKRAIAEMAGTKLMLGRFGEHDIVVTHGETEKVILDGPYRADAYLRFTSSSPLGLKWSGEVYIEVHHTHEVPIEKQAALRSLRAPVVEVPMQTLFEYRFDDDSTTSAREEAHVNFLRNLLKDGYLMGTVISDRRSVEYLEAILAQEQEALKAEKAAHADVLKQLEEAKTRIAALEQQRRENVKTIAANKTSHDELQTQLDAKVREVGELETAQREADGTIADQRETLRMAYWIGGIVLVVSLLLLAFRLYQRYGAADTAQAAEIATPTVQAALAPAPPASKPAKKTGPRPKRPPASAPVVEQ